MININISNIFKRLLACVGLLAFASVMFQAIAFFGGHPKVFGLVDFFYMGNEQNLPTFFTVCLMLLSAILLAHIYTESKIKQRPFQKTWLLLSLLFVALACDEFCMFHEELSALSTNKLGIQASGYFTYAWVVPGMIFVAIVGLLLMRLVLSLPQKTRFWFIVSGAVYISGVIGMEMIGANQLNQQGRTFGYTIIVVIEESLEMLGLILFIRALQDYIANNLDNTIALRI